MERHVGRHCGHDFKLPWQRRWPLGWPESTKAPFFLGFLFVNCLVACSEFNLSSHGHSEKKLTTEPSESLNRRKTVDFRFQRPYATSGSFFFNKPMRAMDSRRDFTSKKKYSQAIFLNLAKKLTRPYKKLVGVGSEAWAVVGWKSTDETV